MKKTTKLGSLAAAVAVVSLMASCQDKEKTAGAVKPAATEVSSSEKIVYVNSDSLLSKYQYFKDLKVRMDGKAKKAEQDVQSKGQAFQREVAQYQAQQSTLPADQRAATEERLGRKQQEFQAYQQNAAAALQNEQNSENVKLYDKIADYLKGYAKKKGYKMVLTYAKGNSAILFADESLDVTNEVINGLNEDYKK
ncbi:OmpH family outer membrane protein [Pedobacter sp. JY14-1]|uniref:OmpH family outer membrane protein n=1 Tax=Pedobacter sp. JY14-1 TaxID=3034151 RepID=UPI0023E34D40|nr:OmpH family outer membrane protein [Pedobacter sp. JY14-1]